MDDKENKEQQPGGVVPDVLSSVASIKNMTFAEQVDAVLTGANATNTHIQVIPNTPFILRQVGLNNLPILMTAKHLKSIVQDSGKDSSNYHGLGAEAVKQLPELLADPVMIMDSLTREDSIVVLTEMQDKENRPVIGAIRLDGKGNDLNGYEISANILTSAYGKDNFQSFIESNISQGTVLYAYKEKSQGLFKTLGIQFSDNLESLSFDTIIRKARAFVNTSQTNFFEKQKDGEKTMTKENTEKVGKIDDNHSHALPQELLNDDVKSDKAVIVAAREKARDAARAMGEPYVTIEWSENPALNAGDVLSLSEADKLLAKLDAEHVGGGYDKVKLDIDYVKDGKLDSYEACRYDIGDEGMGLVDHIQEYWNFYRDNKNWQARINARYLPETVKEMNEEYARMANDVAPYLKQHVDLSAITEKAYGLLTDEANGEPEPQISLGDYDEVTSFVSASRRELNGVSDEDDKKAIHEKKVEVVEQLTTELREENAKEATKQRSARDVVKEVRDQMVQTILDHIQSNPEQWQAGWNNLAAGAPTNAKTLKNYRGINALYLSLVSISKGYTDPRWVTYNQAAELGAQVKKGEKAVPVLFWDMYDRNTKKSYDSRTTKDMTDEEKEEYIRENVYAVMKYSTVFNAAQCDNFPALDLSAYTMSAEERANQNIMIETIIANSAAPVLYDGGNRAYYSPGEDKIHLPPIEAFNSMQDYYATALHEIAHSTMKEDRLNRMQKQMDINGYAIEELRAEMASVFMQIEHGIKLEGKHIESHAAYLDAWLKEVREDPKIFYSAIRDAEKIADYVADNYLLSNLDELTNEEAAEATAVQGEARTDDNVITNTVAGEPFKEIAARVVVDYGDGDKRTVNLTPEAAQTLERGKQIRDNIQSYEKWKQSDNPIMKDYLRFKAEYPGIIVARQLGDFYEVLGDDAKTIANELNLTLTGRDVGLDERVPMVGFPYHSAYNYVDQIRDYHSVVVINGDEYNPEISHYTEKTEAQKMNVGVRKWYSAAYPSDSLIYDINPTTTFNDVQKAINEGKDVYDILVADSVVRERVFGRIAQIRGVTLEAVYSEWNAGNEKQKEMSMQDTEKNQEEKPVQKQAPKTISDELQSSQVWLKINIPEQCIGGTYGEKIMIKMPVGEFSHYALYVQDKYLRDINGNKQLTVGSKLTYRLNNDGKQVELTGAELQDSFGGMTIGKEYTRVAPSRRNLQVLSNIQKNIPKEMQELPLWCCYRTKWNQEKGKKEKFIISPTDGKWASSKTAEQWVTFDKALQYAKDNNCEGLSMLLSREHGITVIDLDKCFVGKNTGEMKERATKLVGELKDTYIERSTSGNGVHIFIKDDILKDGKYSNSSVDEQKGDLEVFDDKRIISVTGDMISETNNLTRANSAVTVYLRQELGERNRQASSTTQRLTSNYGTLGDKELVDWISQSKQGEKFKDLINGRGVSGNKSNDDAKLAHMLLYFSGGDKEQTFRIMRGSNINRPDKPDSYYRQTIDAMDKQIEEYARRPNSSSSAAQQRGRGVNGAKRGQNRQ